LDWRNAGQRRFCLGYCSLGITAAATQYSQDLTIKGLCGGKPFGQVAPIPHVKDFNAPLSGLYAYSPSADQSSVKDTGVNGKGCAGNAVILSSGNKVEYETDYKAAGEFGLSLQRTYNRNSGLQGIFGIR